MYNVYPFVIGGALRYYGTFSLASSTRIHVYYAYP